MGKFGDKFRKERERREIKLEDVSNSTKIGSRMLRAIEEERFDQLPGGVFNKGFIRLRQVSWPRRGRNDHRICSRTEPVQQSTVGRGKASPTALGN